MASRVIRDGLAYPVAAAVALGLVSMPHPELTSASPRLAEISGIRLQAEVSSFVGGLGRAALAELVSVEPVASEPAPAASKVPAAPAASGLGSGLGLDIGTYPVTILDKWLAGLPPEWRAIVRPPLYVVAAALGLVIGLVQLAVTAVKNLFTTLIPAGAAAPAASAPAPAGADDDALRSDPRVASSTPGVRAAAVDGGATAAQPDRLGRTPTTPPVPVTEAPGERVLPAAANDLADPETLETPEVQRIPATLASEDDEAPAEGPARNHARGGRGGADDAPAAGRATTRTAR